MTIRHLDPDYGFRASRFSRVVEFRVLGVS